MNIAKRIFCGHKKEEPCGYVYDKRGIFIHKRQMWKCKRRGRVRISRIYK